MSEEPLSPDEERRILELLERSSLTAYPNPDRIGCPGTDFLRRVAFDRHSVPIAHPGLDHLTQCSPCFAEFIEFRRQARHQRHVRRVSLIATAAVIVIAGVWYILTEWPASSSPPMVAQNVEGGVSDFHINLQNRSAPRGDTVRSEKPLTIPRQRLKLAIDLPLGSEPGVYETQILANAGSPLLQVSGTATLESGITNLTVLADLRSLPPGRYFLGFRRLPWEWTYIPIMLE